MVAPTAHFLAQRGNSPLLRPPAPKPDTPAVRAVAGTAERAGIEKSPAEVSAQTGANSVEKETAGLWGEDGFTFGDILDIINPLQHIPVISTIYRAATGDTISPGARMAGGTLLGGPIGFVAALANNITQGETGKDIGETLLASLGKPQPAAVPIAAQEQQETLTASAAPVVKEEKEIEIAMAAPAAKARPMETMALRMERTPSERLRGPQSEPELKISERLGRGVDGLPLAGREPGSHGLPLKAESKFFALPGRTGHTALKAVAEKSSPTLEPLPGIGTFDPRAEPLFPNDDRDLVDWYGEEHAFRERGQTTLPAQLQKAQAQYSQAKMLGLTQQAGLDLKT